MAMNVSGIVVLGLRSAYNKFVGLREHTYSQPRLG